MNKKKNKFNFISGGSGTGNSAQQMSNELEYEYLPGQAVYTVEDGKIVKQVIISVDLRIQLFINNTQKTEIKYKLSGKKHRMYSAKQLCLSISDLPIIDQTNDISAIHNRTDENLDDDVVEARAGVIEKPKRKKKVQCNIDDILAVTTKRTDKKNKLNKDRLIPESKFKHEIEKLELEGY